MQEASSERAALASISNGTRDEQSRDQRTRQPQHASMGEFWRLKACEDGVVGCKETSSTVMDWKWLFWWLRVEQQSKLPACAQTT